MVMKNIYDLRLIRINKKVSIIYIRLNEKDEFN